ncbi:BAR-domain-containing protein [Xylona heveae TC161]|uniref:BAR-domain-containing protein n=1 Tax=Xylona heveae (strain CBS 132557 / TC161) TaxID=1328760 RepID=A0A165GSN2_XYLHT|nr:BAR-domain-containing protein [Xylona heveae TC161]KZF22545.1 BAR-domain-containing protein [Xylona heveae TC161]
MNVNKKLDRFKQWAGERMGGEAKTCVSEDFKALEEEMVLRHDGMERLQKGMTVYVKSLSKRSEGDDKEKVLPVALLGSTMISHGEDFDHGSEFGSRLLAMGRTHERIARIQENYVANATSAWLESLERSLAQMKEYQASRKKLESRRLAYDASLAKVQKAKKEDFRVEEELRSQKAKYEESSEDVYRRMQDIKESECESISDLEAFLDSELRYFENCHEVLMQLKRDWPATSSQTHENRRNRSRSVTAHSYGDRFSAVEEEPEPAPMLEPRRSIRSTRVASSSLALERSPRRDMSGIDMPVRRPTVHRASTTERHASNSFEGPTQLYREYTGHPAPGFSRIPTDPPTYVSSHSQFPSASRHNLGHDVFGDPTDDNTLHSTSSPERSWGDQSSSPATSYSSGPSRKTSSSTLNAGYANKKAPPPPPPSRAKKPPPPPPLKRSAISTSSVPFA